MDNPLVSFELHQLLERNETESLKQAFENLHQATVAEFLGTVPPERVWPLLMRVEVKRRAEIFRDLNLELQVKLVSTQAPPEVAELLGEMAPDDRADLIQKLDDDVRQEILPLLARAERENIRRLTSYAEDTAGAIMTTDYVALPEDITVGQAWEELRIQAPDKETIYSIYVVDRQRHLTGFLTLKDLILARPATRRLGEVAQGEVVSVRAEDDQEGVARKLSDYDFVAIPVVDSENCLVGIVTFDDVIDVVDEEAGEDLYHMASVSTDEKVSTPFFTSVRLRWWWLLINLGTSILAALTVSLFAGTIARYVALAVMMPIVAGMGGNAGTQTMAVVVRGLALGELTLRNSWAVILKEVGVGLVNGMINGLVMAGIAYAWYRNFWLSLIMFLAMIANLMIAGLFGAALPVVLKLLRFDPALASSIFITTATDVGGFTIFLGLAALLSRFLIS